MPSAYNMHPKYCCNNLQPNLDWSKSIVTIQGLACGANLWFGGFPYPVNPGRPEWSKVQIRGKPLVAMAQATCVSAGE